MRDWQPCALIMPSCTRIFLKVAISSFSDESWIFSLKRVWPTQFQVKDLTLSLSQYLDHIKVLNHNPSVFPMILVLIDAITIILFHLHFIFSFYKSIFQSLAVIILPIYICEVVLCASLDLLFTTWSYCFTHRRIIKP